MIVVRDSLPLNCIINYRLSRARRLCQLLAERVIPQEAIQLDFNLNLLDIYELRAVIRATRWVGKNVEYMSDERVYGISEYWQSPSETLNYMQGDCEDQAVLLSSVLLVSRIPDVLLVTGYMLPSGDGHAWVEWFSGRRWYILEATSGEILSGRSEDYVPLCRCRLS